MNSGPDKRAVALGSVTASALLTLAKLAVGLLTGSLGILSEAAHSLLDLGAAGLTYFAVRLADQPADARHHYGHGKVESVSALIETGLLFLTSAWIIREAVERLLAGGPAVETTWYAVMVMLFSMAVDFTRSRALMKVAKATRSQALEADALHFSSDILSSAVVLVGLLGVWLGFPKADAVAAIGVALFVVRVGYDLGKRTIDVLMDAAPEGLTERVADIVCGIEGVARVESVRARPAGSEIFVEVLVRVSRTMPLDRAQDVCDAVAATIRRHIPGAQAFVKAQPLTLDNESIVDTVRITAAKQGIMVHDVGVHALGERLHVSFDIEVDEGMNIRDAHAIATAIERDLRDELGEDVLVDSHIDPRRFSVVVGTPVDETSRRRLAEAITALAEEVPEVENVHQIHVQKGEQGLYVSLHCQFAPAAPVRMVHDATLAVEQRVRRRIEGVSRVVVHAEPLGDMEDQPADPQGKP